MKNLHKSQKGIIFVPEIEFNLRPIFRKPPYSGIFYKEMPGTPNPIYLNDLFYWSVPRGQWKGILPCSF